MDRHKSQFTYDYSPLNQRFKSTITKLTYLLTAVNLFVFIWLSSSRPFFRSPEILITNIPADLPGACLSYWQNTSFEVGLDCLKRTLSDDVFNFDHDTEQIEKCQSSQLHDFWQSPNEFFTFLPINILRSSDKKVISFSLYGGADRYLRNVVRIIRRYRSLLPDWLPRFWLGSDVPFLMINRLVLEGAEVIIVHQKKPVNGTRVPSYHGMFWRFFISDDENVSRYIVRDSDSMLIQREVDAMNQWIQEDTTFHVMRDHREHSIEILGGMWGGKVDKKIFSASREYAKALKKDFGSRDNKGLDQEFLKTFLWPIAKKQMTCHTAFHWAFVDSRGCKDFPTKRNGTSFIGAIMQ